MTSAYFKNAPWEQRAFVSTHIFAAHSTAFAVTACRPQVDHTYHMALDLLLFAYWSSVRCENTGGIDSKSAMLRWQRILWPDANSNRGGNSCSQIDPILRSQRV